MLLPSQRIRILDIAATYALTDRINISADLPIVFNRFSALLPPLGPRPPALRYDLLARGVGDLSLVTRSWLLDGNKHPLNNVALGVGLLLPTGNFRNQAVYGDVVGSPARKKPFGLPADLPGQGGVGVVFDFQAYKTFVRRPLRNATLFATGLYLAQPRNTLPTPSIYSGLGAQFVDPQGVQNALILSVADSWFLEGGIALPPVPGARAPLVRGFRPVLAYRFEGTKQKDIFGRNDGYRNPGWLMAWEPGFIYVRGTNILALSVPIVTNRMVNYIPTVRPGSQFRGNGTVAPAGIVLRYTRLF